VLLQDLFGDGLLSSYAAPSSIAGMYGQQPARPAFQYGQAGVYQHQPASFQQQSGPYQQPQPSRPPGLPHGMSFNGHGQGPSAGMLPTGPSPAFDGPVRQRSHSDATGTGVCVCSVLCAKLSWSVHVHLMCNNQAKDVWGVCWLHQ